MLVWIDLETTGLDPNTGKVLEVACVITDDQLNEVARFEAVTDEARNVNWKDVDPIVLDMHFKNGLWEESLRKKGWQTSIEDIDVQLREFICQHGQTRKINALTGVETEKVTKPPLAGSSVHFDRTFMVRHLRRSESELHYRIVDVSSFNEVGSRFWNSLYKARPREEKGIAHRALPDILHSIGTLRHYLNGLVNVVPEGYADKV